MKKTTLVESIKSAYKEEMKTELLINGFTGYTNAAIIASISWKLELCCLWSWGAK